ncbi:rap guanine nucleotide exchange factor 1-like isoform X8 [Labeo rohita]|uniref:Rap guanine nucleotide exchange factor 1-like isoform X8 n=1 Tax=Labeo rohita TaxID=84645 RepID=A0A498NQG7_LABRO|nr:rap guanine nucleotide exchange factor 1-like isoform X8 [Labeo rohita]
MGNSSRRTQPLLEETDYFYSGEADTESQKSHLSSFTMKLMKFHSPKIKRTPSKKSKQLQPEPTVTTPEKPVNKKVSRLEEQEKEVVSALRYFKTIVDKMSVDTKVLQMLPGSASKVLEAILPLMQVEARIQHSSAVSSCHNRVYQSLANLIRWSDQVMLEGIDLDDKDTVTTVTTVIKAVLDGVKDLVKLTIEKQEQPSPTSPSKPAPPVVKPESVCENPLTEREKAILSKTTPIVTPTDSLTDMSEEEVAPPKPPLPGVKLAEHSSFAYFCILRRSPPALPPKKRQSAPSPTRVAVVAPMSRVPCGLNLPPGALRQQQEFDVDLLQRRFSGGSQSYGGDSPRLSPCNSMGKLSKSDEQLSSLERDSGQCSRNTSCETLEGYDPDYDFLHQDLSVSEPLPFPTGGSSLSPLPECHAESQSLSPAQGPAHPRFSAPVTNQASLEYWSPPLTPGPTNSVLPPALPQKKRRSAPIISAYPLYERLPSHYDNLSEEEQPTPPFPLVTPASPLPQVNGGDDFSRCTDADSPPPLPEKKGKQILQYMQFVEDYSEPQPSVFYQMPQNESIYEQRRNKRFQEVYGFNDSYSSSDSVHEPVPPPALPPKQRQLSESVDEGGEGEYVNLYSSTQANGENTHRTDPSSCDDVLQDHTPHIPTSNSKEALSKDRPKEPSHSQIDDVDELSLIDHNEIMNRITLKAEFAFSVLD